MKTLFSFLGNLFVGRLSQKEYLLGLGVYIIVGLAYFVGAIFLFDVLRDILPDQFERYAFVVLFAPIAAIIFLTYALNARRLHDIDWAGWLVLFSNVPFVNIILFIVTIFVPSHQKGEKYGSMPMKMKSLTSILWNHPGTEGDRGEKWLAGVFVVLLMLGLVLAVALPERPNREFGITPVSSGVSIEEHIDAQITGVTDVQSNIITGIPGVSSEPPSVSGRYILAGDLYSFELPEGGYGVGKILVTDGSNIFIALYFNEFDVPPKAVEQKDLSDGYNILAERMLQIGEALGESYFIRRGVVTERDAAIIKEWLMDNGFDGIDVSAILERDSGFKAKEAFQADLEDALASAEWKELAEAYYTSCNRSGGPPGSVMNSASLVFRDFVHSAEIEGIDHNGVFILPCSLHAYQTSQMLVRHIGDEYVPLTFTYLDADGSKSLSHRGVEVSYSPGKDLYTTFAKLNGMATCWSRGEYQVTNGELVLQKYEAQLDCDAPYGSEGKVMFDIANQ